MLKNLIGEALIGETMKKRFSSIFFVCSLGLLVACQQGLDQDPLANQPDEIRNGVDRGAAKPAPKPTPLPSESLRIDTAEFYSFKETLEGSATVSGRVLIPIGGKTAEKGVDYEVNIENMSAFPGASYDAITGQFKWTPPRGFVDMEYTRNMSLIVSLNTKIAPVLSIRRIIPVFVTRVENDPEIIKVEGLSNGSIREGSTREFQVVVKDPDAADNDWARPRLLVVNNRAGSHSAAAMISLVQPGWGNTNPTVDPNDKHLWVFKLNVDARDREVTASESLLSFGLIAVSRFGRSSSPENVDVRFLTNVRKPVISWKDTLNFVGGRDVLINFNVFDPQSEGRVLFRFDRCVTLPGSPYCTCAQQGANNLLCTIRWKVPDVSSVIEYVIEGVAENLSPVLSDSQKATAALSGRVRVTPAPKSPPDPSLPTPAPAPNPTPEPASGDHVSAGDEHEPNPASGGVL